MSAMPRTGVRLQRTGPGVMARPDEPAGLPRRPPSVGLRGKKRNRPRWAIADGVVSKIEVAAPSARRPLNASTAQPLPRPLLWIRSTTTQTYLPFSLLARFCLVPLIYFFFPAFPFCQEVRLDGLCRL